VREVRVAAAAMEAQAAPATVLEAQAALAVAAAATEAQVAPATVAQVVLLPQRAVKATVVLLRQQAVTVTAVLPRQQAPMVTVLVRVPLLKETIVLLAKATPPMHLTLLSVLHR
jgi:hypothetical protein